MPISTIDASDDDFGPQSYRKLTGEDSNFHQEVQSEDGIFCPYCGRRAGWHEAKANSVNRCKGCEKVFYTCIEVKHTYISHGMRHKAPFSNN